LLKRFASGLAANGLFVASGVFKQYLIASALSVVDFGAYGSLVAVASLFLVSLPFPAYLGVMIRGFSAAPNAYGTRKQLTLSVRHELAVLVVAGMVCLAAIALLATTTPFDGHVWPLVLLLFVQYTTACVDLLLRMQQAHQRLALFMSLRNAPALVVLWLWHPSAPWQVCLVDFFTALVVALVFLRAPELRIRTVFRWRRLDRKLDRERVTLWLARLAQFGNSSLLRLLVPLLYGAHETGLFFFALIAQLPCSLFLSVTTQLYGHTLARIERGDWRTLWRTQGLFALPNAAYVLACAVFVPYWHEAIAVVPKLAKYGEAGPLILGVVVYGTVLSSDCQEYLLRARGLSRVLLRFSIVSVVVQCTTVWVSSLCGLRLQHTLFACAGLQALVLAGFSTYSFRLVVGRRYVG
jgi:hypothetical protein